MGFLLFDPPLFVDVHPHRLQGVRVTCARAAVDTHDVHCRCSSRSPRAVVRKFGFTIEFTFGLRSRSNESLTQRDLERVFKGGLENAEAVYELAWHLVDRPFGVPVVSNTAKMARGPSAAHVTRPLIIVTVRVANSVRRHAFSTTTHLL